METISRLAHRFGLSRSTLLYYDRIGLLRASARSGARYRRYDAADARRLELICLYRAAGVALADVARILESPQEALGAVLERRLQALQEEQTRIRAQQDVIIRILERPDLARRYRGLDRRGWTRLLRAIGLDEPAMLRWHGEFERVAPEAHREFLASLRIPAARAERIRRAARRVALAAPAVSARAGTPASGGPRGGTRGTGASRRARARRGRGTRG